MIDSFNQYFREKMEDRKPIDESELKDAKLECPMCESEMEIAESPCLDFFMAWTRCKECGMSSGPSSGKTKEEARNRAIYSNIHRPMKPENIRYGEKQNGDH